MSMKRSALILGLSTLCVGCMGGLSGCDSVKESLWQQAQEDDDDDGFKIKKKKWKKIKYPNRRSSKKSSSGGRGRR
ncbi:hypothetical protein [Pasteuria penetrans]|uniref:hypothetical protein n=1 Tax=Pasteuria penetrans TaxID=86005 RepID=UPI0011F0768F|nr:hypothetical protein [Pasteuria penetrans]